MPGTQFTGSGIPAERFIDICNAYVAALDAGALTTDRQEQIAVLVLSYLVGDRSGHAAKTFIHDLASRMAHRIQLSSDGHRPYVDAVEYAFGDDVDYGIIIKKYAGDGSNKNADTRYSPAACTGIDKHAVTGNPDEDHISTSYVERLNLTTRMCVRRFTRLTNAFSKKIENHAHAVALHFFVYNFCRIHKSLRVSPAMAAGVTDRLMDVDELVQMLIDIEDAEESRKGPRRTRGRK